MKINELRDKIHTTAKEKGFYEAERNAMTKLDENSKKLTLKNTLK